MWRLNGIARHQATYTISAAVLMLKEEEVCALASLAQKNFINDKKNYLVKIDLDHYHNNVRK